jgi:hypothetical protein
MGKIVDTLIVFRILKLLTTDFKDTNAYKFGFIDKDGTRIKYKTSDTSSNQKIKNDPKTSEEKDSYTLLHKMVFNIKRLIQKVPLGKSKFATYASALALIKEHMQLSDPQSSKLIVEFSDMYFGKSDLQETYDFDKLEVGGVYQLRRPLHQLDETYPPKLDVFIVEEHSVIYGVSVYTGLIDEHKVLVTFDDIC